MRVLFAFLCFTFCFSSCVNEKEEVKDQGIHPDMIFHDYKIMADEGREEVTMMFQYRLGEEDGDSFILESPSKVSLDGMELKPDSANLTGTFYESSRPLAGFSGEHTIVFTDSRNKEHKTKFHFQPFTIAEEIPEQISKKPFSILLSDFPPGPTTIRLVMIDTAFETADVNEDLIVRKGVIRIDSQKLANLANGPITLEIQREQETLLKGFSKEGGRLLITYGLRRNFEFVD